MYHFTIVFRRKHMQLKTDPHTMYALATHWHNGKCEKFTFPHFSYRPKIAID